MNRPEISSGKLRPCGPLLQLVVAYLSKIHSIGRRIRVVSARRLDLVILPIFYEYAHSFRGHQQAGSLAGAAPWRKSISRAQRQAHSGWKSGVERKGKSLSDCFLKSKEIRIERLA